MRCVYGAELLNALLLLEWVNWSELSFEIVKVDILSSSIILVDKEGIALVKDKVIEDWVYLGRVKTNNVVCDIL